MSTRRPAEFAYGGGELELFASARNWKAYLRRQLSPYLRGRVLEVGAGLGATTQALAGSGESSWICLEPDAAMASQIRSRIGSGNLPRHCDVVVGTTETCGELGPFDAILYVDVLEHIENDRAEVARAARLLADGGHMVVLAPAHQWLYSPFDRAIGHHRRYTRRSLEGLVVPEAHVRASRYLDSAGLLASLGNRLLLKRSMPTAAQVRTWDGLLVPVSRALDAMLGYTAGKSVLVVWQK